ncbi:uncharacterized protein EI97DRAFT_232373 [Westerdykella ornata]|uniref:Uncharacterized protein n=1 Tax=Westerdykella ornata TaxID=318751 RepID=A0A6A6JAJ9_WESOR|nr:uncharacterized protein EI97DRAFT_232373 [Westerdykella ornata]KAF2272219.1 hypothetical protein EI97DRAFT_232373 [Westerdykella ornata]
MHKDGSVSRCLYCLSTALSTWLYSPWTSPSFGHNSLQTVVDRPALSVDLFCQFAFPHCQLSSPSMHASSIVPCHSVLCQLRLQPQSCQCFTVRLRLLYHVVLFYASFFLNLIPC